MPAATTTSGRALTVGLLLAGFLLAGCGQPNPLALPEYDPDATTTGSPAEPKSTRRSPDIVRVATPSPEVRYRPADALGQGAWVKRGRVAAKSPTQRAVVQAVMKYLSVRLQLSNTWKVDEQALAASASGQAVTNARERAEQQRNDNLRSIGRFIMNISSVQVNGDQATVTGCHFDATSEVDRDGYVLIAPPGGVLITMKLRRTGNTWRVLDWPERPVPSCEWPK
jgi:predicted small lipoprotein YifL